MEVEFQTLDRALKPAIATKLKTFRTELVGFKSQTVRTSTPSTPSKRPKAEKSQHRRNKPKPAHLSHPPVVQEAPHLMTTKPLSPKPKLNENVS